MRSIAAPDTEKSSEPTKEAAVYECIFLGFMKLTHHVYQGYQLSGKLLQREDKAKMGSVTGAIGCEIRTSKQGTWSRCHHTGHQR
jgi:hypothetical protein